MTNRTPSPPPSDDDAYHMPRAGHGSPVVTALLYVGFVLLAVLVFAAAFVIGSSPASQIRDHIIAEVKTSTGRDLVIGGDTSFSFWPTLGLVLHDVRLSAPSDMNAPPTASIKSLEVKIKARSLLAREIEVEQLIVREPVIELRVDGKGRRSWRFAGPSADSRQRYAEAPSATRTDAAGGVAAASGKDRTLDLRDLSLGDVRIENGTVRYSDERHAGAAQAITDINARLTLAALDRPLDARGDMLLEGQKVEFDGRLSTLQDVMRARPGKLAFDISSGPLKVKFDGTVKAREQVDLDGTLDATSPSARALLKWLGVALPASDGFGPLALKGQLSAAGKSLLLDKATIKLDGATGTGSLGIAQGEDRPLIRARLDISELDLNKYASTGGAPAAKRGGRKAKQPTSTEEPPQTIEDLLKPPARQVRGYERRNGWSEEVIDTGLLSLADAEATLSIGRLMVREIKVGKTGLQVDLKRSRLVAKVVDMTLYEGKGHGTISIDGAGSIPSVALDLAIDGVSAQPFLNDAAAMNWLAGRGNLQLKVSGQGAHESAIMHALGGTAAFQFTDGAIVGLNIAQLLRGGGAADTTDFSELSASFAIGDGVARNTDLKMVSPLLRVGGSGNIMIGDRQLDYVARPKIVGSLSGKGGQFNLAGLEVPVKIKGSWDNPDIAPDFSGLVKDPSKAVDVVKEIGKQLGGKKAGDLLKGLLGDD